MVSKFCMNEACRLTTSSEWKQGWELKSGGFATLCSNCGTAYENSIFCVKFHLKEDGWRECRICRKLIHCGCVASKLLHEYLDFGGVGCISCAKYRINPSTRSVQKIGPYASVGQNKGKGIMLPSKEVKTRPPNFTQHSVGSSKFVNPDNTRQNQVFKDASESRAQPSLNSSLGNASSASDAVVPFNSDGSSAAGSEATKGMASQTRIVMRPPPADWRGRCQLLPRYWPRITDQELQQISGNFTLTLSLSFKSTVVPLFEKVLSASDAGRIGRLVLPKACAEGYFPPIYQSEGVPLRIQDVKGNKWIFQFRFWPNNNSRMYVLEGVTPCIQKLRLQAGDTVTFSRIDPGGQIVMGFRKSTTNVDTQPSNLPNVGSFGETSYSAASDDMLAVNAYPCLVYVFSESNMFSSCGFLTISILLLIWSLLILENGKNGSQTLEDPSQQHILIPEKKKTQKIELKNKRPLIRGADVVEIRVNIYEAQEFLRPATKNPTIFKIDDCELEEYEEPPVFGKRTIFTLQPSGKQEQWVECDSCSKWRRLPVHVIVPARWTCSDNVLVSNSSCSDPDDINPRELEALNIASKDYKRKRITETIVVEDDEPSGLDTLATAAVLGDKVQDSTEISPEATTTKHPRHRPGCTCIVCIQPPSGGKYKHPSSCKCNVCMSVRRRFKLPMNRRRRRQSAPEAEQHAFGKDEQTPLELSEMEGTTEDTLLLTTYADADRSQLNENLMMEMEKRSKGNLDLNCYPSREDDMVAEAVAASISLDMYMRQNGNKGCSTSAYVRLKK
ncbi:hypothetical protein ACH5RR_020543 [Cinchona calisaya]|uniref:Uncharacterized protein n=1 Tax=Cinchona calisaya TaxID=153742 RepID=A0ABD2ZFR5_9GENT